MVGFCCLFVCVCVRACVRACVSMCFVLFACVTPNFHCVCELLNNWAIFVLPRADSFHVRRMYSETNFFGEAVKGRLAFLKKTNTLHHLRHKKALRILYQD